MVGDVEVRVESTGKVTAVIEDLIVAVGSEGVTCLHEASTDTVVRGGHTVVVLLAAKIVCADHRVAGGVKHTHINRINRSDVGRVVHQVRGTPIRAHVWIGGCL